MKLINKITKNLVLVSVLTFTIFSCGDSTRNDQGVSFTLLGWFQDAQGTTGASGFSIPLSSSSSEAGGEINDLLTFIGVQNHLSNQAIRVRRVEHSYIVPGANISIPRTAVIYSSVLGPSGSLDQNFNSESTLPDSFGGGQAGAGAGAGAGGAVGGGTAGQNAISPVSYGEMAIVPSSILSFLNLNRNSLPELPFTMIVRSYAVGVTTAGHTITSNDFETQVYFTADTPIAPTEGTTTATSSNFQLDDFNTDFELDDFESDF